MKTGKFNRILNYVMGFIILALWVSILIIHGIAGAVAWALAILFIAPVGVILVLVNLTLLIISFVSKTKVAPKAISLILSILLAVPGLMLLNILQIEYPAKIDKVKPSIMVKWPLKERATVGWGGNNIANNAPHTIWASERWAYDLVMEPANIGSKNVRDYGIYDKEVIAPVSGTIVAAYDKENDIEHHQRQDPTKTIYPIFAEGLPLYFKDIDGEPMPPKGSFITPKN